MWHRCGRVIFGVGAVEFGDLGLVKVLKRRLVSRKACLQRWGVREWFLEECCVSRYGRGVRGSGVEVGVVGVSEKMVGTAVSKHRSRLIAV